ncbi:hypothetical protein BegalDRAFT_2484 [Beggiatoa alba B18LD]|uniref:Uncharacterized protein n=1 Tax=Beggiatoa alba B18LD TaxID=395493 RepID=I3CI86_9GAMM|nr:hypothetical protein [Beggiatoa alba]EIJ43329.1 hypothetical protein BegalDRAFT_2484 [Beggiatoa alba B18LD]
MTEQRRKLFREVALKQHTSPEQLDQLIQITSTREWLFILAILLGLSMALGWYWFGTQTTEVTSSSLLSSKKNTHKLNIKAQLETRLTWLRTLSHIPESQRPTFIQQQRLSLARQLDDLSHSSPLINHTTPSQELATAYALLLQMTLSENNSDTQIQQAIQTLQQQINNLAI